MENPTSFDLNTALRVWRESVSATSALPWTDLDELEQHLRDSVANLQQRGLALEEAWWIARRRLGASADLAVEFGKVHPEWGWKRPLIWMGAGWLAVTLASGLAKALASLGLMAVWAIQPLGSIAGLAGVSQSFVRVLTSAGILALGWRLRSRFVEVGHWVEKGPGANSFARALLVILLPLLGVSALQMGTEIGAVRFISPSALGNLFYGQSVGGMFAYLLLPVLWAWGVTRGRGSVTARRTVL